MKLKNKLLQKTPKCFLKLCFQTVNSKVLLVCVPLILRTRLFLHITSIIDLKKNSILRAFSKILNTAG